MDSDEPVYQARTEGGQAIDDPSEDDIFELITELADPDNTFVAIQQLVDDPPWRAVVTLLPGGGFEVEYRDRAGPEHRVITETSPDRIALDLIVWVSSVVRNGGW